MAALQIVWFKRDLRIVDHRPLAAAVERGLVLPLYVVEPELWRQPDASCLLYTSPSPRDATLSRMPSSA